MTAIEQVKVSEEKDCIVKLVESIESGVIESISCGGKSYRSVELWKESSIPSFHRFRTYKLPLILLCGKWCQCCIFSLDIYEPS